MSWFKGKGMVRATAVKETAPVPRQTPAHIGRELEDRLAAFLIEHDRLAQRDGRPLMHLLGVSHNQHDGTTDYAVRSRVHDIHGKDWRFDSTIRLYPTGRLRLIR
jgi:hypothetical protein